MNSDSPTASHGPDEPWTTCVVPFVVFIGTGLLEPAPGGLASLLGIPTSAYPIAYSIRVAATAIAIALAWPRIRRWVGTTTWWPIPLGLALVVPWIVLASLQRELGWTTPTLARSGFDPFEYYGPGSAAGWAFVAVRAIGLVMLVPLAEELFLRGFLMRYVIDENFWTVPFGKLTLASAMACLAYAASTHPAEIMAAICWFAVVSGIAVATRRPIDAILAHAATNIALGAYVIATKSWWLM
jgi:CAAX prenyl protease-like protein